MTTTDLESIRAAQRSDTRVILAEDSLTLVGVEVVIERRWFREEYWPHVGEGVASGYLYAGTNMRKLFRADRRSPRRGESALLIGRLNQLEPAQPASSRGQT